MATQDLVTTADAVCELCGAASAGADLHAVPTMFDGEDVYMLRLVCRSAHRCMRLAPKTPPRVRVCDVEPQPPVPKPL